MLFYVFKNMMSFAVRGAIAGRNIDVTMMNVCFVRIGLKRRIVGLMSQRAVALIKRDYF